MYSKIKSIRIKNFMSIKEESIIEFDERNIINLCGYNDSGKTGATMLLEIIFYDAYSHEQYMYISDGEDYWEGEVTFEDGMSIVRRKFKNGQSNYELWKEEKLIFTNELENGDYAAMPDIPEVIQKVLGVSKDETTGEKLNVRRNRDKMFLIQTTGGENYKMLNTFLRNSVLNTTIKNMNDDKNELKNKINKNESREMVLKEQKEKLKPLPMDLEKELINLVNETETIYNKVNFLSELNKLKKQKNEIIIPNKLKTISNINKIRKLNNLNNMIKEKNSFIPKKLENKTFEIQKTKKLLNLLELFNEKKEEENKLSKLKEELIKNQLILEKLSDKYDLKICNNCGSLVK